MNQRALAAKPAAPAGAQANLQRKPIPAARPESASVLNLASSQTNALASPGEGNPQLVPAKVVKPSLRIHDEDQARALLTHFLLEQLAPRLGLDASKIEIHIDREAEQKLAPVQAQGMQQGQQIFLRPDAYAPDSLQGRYLLAHELSHLAQRQLPALNAVDQLARVAAEQEAHALATEFAQQHSISAVQAWLPSNAYALNTEAEKAADPEQVRQDLREQVLQARQRELALLAKYLGGIWISDGDVAQVLELLDALPFAVASALIAVLPGEQRKDLIDNINPPHVIKNRKMVLACFDAIANQEEYDVIDMKVLRSMSASGMSNEEALTMQTVLRRIGESKRMELLRGGNGDAIAHMIRVPRLSVDEQRAMLKSAQASLLDETKIAKNRAAITQEKAGADSQQLFAQIKYLLTPRHEHDTEHQPNGADALAALGLLGNASDARIAAVGELLDAEGIFDSLLRMLPVSAYFEPARHGEILKAITANRLPSKNAELIEELLSYGLLDWAVRDSEALFAYKIIKSLPLSEQYRFRLRDGGKWYFRLLANLPRDIIKYPDLEIRKAGSKDELLAAQKAYQSLLAEGDKSVLASETGSDEQMYYSASQLYEKRLQKPDAQDELHDLVQAFEKAKEGIFRDHEAINLYVQLVALAWGSLKLGHESKTDNLLRETVIRELDHLGYIELLFGELPDSYLFNESNRVRTVQIMLARDPSRVQAHARELVSRGFLDWMVKDCEAYLAYQCVKALPQDEREEFIRQFPQQWAAINDEMSEAQRQARDLNLYHGDQAGTDRASVLAQLSSPSTWREEKTGTWQEEQASLLDGLLLMAVAMSERRFAFEQSKKFCQELGADKLAPETRLAMLIEKYQLWRKGVRETYIEQQAERTKWHEEGPFTILKSLGHLAVALWNTSFIYVENKIGFETDLNSVQNLLGGDIGGAKLAEPGQHDIAKTNQISLTVDTNLKHVQLHLPNLKIEQANMQMAGSTAQTGAMNLNNLFIHAYYDSDKFEQPVQASLELGNLDVSDVLLAKSDKMLAISNLEVSRLRCGIGTMDSKANGGTPPKGKAGFSIPFPFLIPLLIPLLVIFGLPLYLYKKIASTLNQDMSEHGKIGDDFINAAKSVDFSLDSMELRGMTSSGGQQINNVAVKNVALGIGANRATALRAELASIDARLARLAGKTGADEAVLPLKLRREAILPQLEKAKQSELRYHFLRNKISKGKFAPGEEEAIQKELEQLDFDNSASAFLDIGSIEAAGIGGGGSALKTSEPIRFSGIHGQGSSSALAQLMGGNLQTAGQTNADLQAGRSAEPILGANATGGFTLDLDHVQTGRIEVGGGFITVADIDKKLQELEKIKSSPQQAKSYQDLTELRKLAYRYEVMVQHGLSTLMPDELREFHQLRSKLSNQASLIINSIDIERAQLEISMEDGRVGFKAALVNIMGIQMPQRGLSIQELHVADLDLSATVGDGLLGFMEWRRHLRSGDLKVGKLSLKGVEDKQSGIGFQELAVNRFKAKIDTHLDQANRSASASISAGYSDQQCLTDSGIMVTGANLRFSQIALEQAFHKLQAYDASKLDAKKKKVYEAKLKDLRGLLFTLYELQKIVADDQARLASASTADEKKFAEEMLATDQASLNEWSKKVEVSKFTVDGLNLSITGLGDILDEKYDPKAVMQRGVTISGAGANQRMFDHIGIEGTNLRQGERTSSYTDKIDIGPFSGSVVYASNSIQLKGSLASATVAGVSYNSPSAQIWCTDKVDMTMLTVDITLFTPPANPDGTPGTGPSKLEINEFAIDRLAGKQLGYKDHQSGLVVEIASGSINAISLRALKVEMPADEFADSKISEDASKGTKEKPSGVRIGSTDKVALVAKTAAGLTASGQLDAGTLDAHFISNGDQTLDLKFLRFTGGKLFRKGVKDKDDMDIDVDTDVSGIHIRRMADGKTMRSRADSINVKAAGSLGKKEFAVKINEASTGEILSNDKEIYAPNVSLPDISLSRLHLEGENYILDVPDGGLIQMLGAKMNVEIDLNQNPKGDESPYKLIAIRDFRIPFTVLGNAKITLIDADDDGDNIELSIPPGVTAGIEDIVLTPSPNNDAFTFTPDKDWAMEGNLGFTKLEAVRAGLKLGRNMEASANLKLETFKMGFLSNGKNTIELAHASASEIEGKIKGSPFFMRTGKTRHAKSGIEARGFYKDMHGNISLESLSAYGFKYDDTGLGLHLDIGEASVKSPNGQPIYRADGSVFIEHLDIKQADFKIDDLLNMGDKTAKKEKPNIMHPDLFSFLDTLQGDINVNVHLDLEYKGVPVTNAATTHDFPLVLHIEKGQIDYVQLEKSLFRNSAVFQQAIDFELTEEGRLFIQLDLKTLLLGAGILVVGSGGALIFGAAAGGLAGSILGGAAGLAGGAYLSQDLYGWDLSDKAEPGQTYSDRELARRKHKIRMKTMVGSALPKAGEAEEKERKEAERKASGKPEEKSDLTIKNISVTTNSKLNLMGESEIDLGNLNKAGLSGRIILGGPGSLNGVEGFSMVGGTSNSIALGMDLMRLRVEDLKLAGEKKDSLKRKGASKKTDTTINTGAIQIGKLENASLDFDKGVSGAMMTEKIFPKQLKGTVSSASAENIVVQMKKTETPETNPPAKGAKKK